jgi:hypothetical protein
VGERREGWAWKSQAGQHGIWLSSHSWELAEVACEACLFLVRRQRLLVLCVHLATSNLYITAVLPVVVVS